MRATWLCVAMVVALAGASHASEPVAAAALRIDANDTQVLKDRLLALAEERLQPAGLFVDRQRAWMSLSESLPPTHIYEVRPTWSADGQVPPLPLTFELQPAVHSGSGVTPIQATLAVPLLREVGVAARRLRKGSAVTCAEVTIRRRDVGDVPTLPLATPCEMEPGVVALRDIAAGDVIRSADFGRAPDVTAGFPVRVSVAIGGISVTTSAIALADARVGDQIDVRLQRPARTLRTRVTGPGSVQLMGGSP